MQFITKNDKIIIIILTMYKIFAELIDSSEVSCKLRCMR